MTSAAKKILEQALTLPEEDRRRLTQALLDSLPREPADALEEAWRQEVLTRIEQARQGEVTLEVR